MKPEQLIDQLADAIGVPRTATSMTIVRDWPKGSLSVRVEFSPNPVPRDIADNIVRAAQDFTLRELPGIRDAIEIKTGS